LQVDAAAGPVGFQTKIIAGLEPVGDLFDGGGLQVGGERCLAGGGGCAGEDVPSGVGNAGEGGNRGRGSVERGGK
jgi:hypothetical protein